MFERLMHALPVNRAWKLGHDDHIKEEVEAESERLKLFFMKRFKTYYADWLIPYE